MYTNILADTNKQKKSIEIKNEFYIKLLTIIITFVGLT